MIVRDTILMTSAALAAALDGERPPLVLAVRSGDSVVPQPYAAHPRIPGALESVMPADFASPTHPVRGSRPLPAAEDLQAALRRWGVQSDSRIVVYDHDGGLIAARAWWVLRWAGLDARLLDGGFAAWQAAGFAIADEPPAPPAPSAITIATGHMPVFGPDAAGIYAADGVLLDSRIGENYRGGPAAPGEARRGHIPGAFSIPAPDNLDAQGCFLDEAALRALYAPTGVFEGVPVGVYCGAGVSAAHDIAVLATLGIEAALYPGSWSAWISDPARPSAIGAARG